MKKNKLFRLLTLALTLVFLCQFAVPAFAYTSNTWTDGSSTYWLETYTNGTQWRNAVTITSTYTQHYQGNITMWDMYYDMYVEESWDNDPYDDELHDTLDNTSHRYWARDNGFQVYDGCGGIKSEERTGKYHLKVGVDYLRIGYVVYQEYYGAQNQWDSGQVYSPQTFGDLVVGYEYAGQ